MKKVYIIAAMVSIIAAFAIYKFAVMLENNSLPENVERTNVVVAAVDIAENTEITEEMVRLIQLPKEAVMANTAEGVEQLVGRLATVSFVANEQVILSQTAGQGEKNNDRLSAELKENEYPVTIDVSVITGTAGYIKEGDSVTLLSEKEKPDGTKEIAVIYKNIPVIRVSESYARDALEYKTLTLVFPETEVFNFIRYQESTIIRPVLESAFKNQGNADGQGG